MKRPDSREPDELRPLSFQPDIQAHPDGSVLAVMGSTKVICSVFIQNQVPKWITDENMGWATCEYDMLPGATTQRNMRDASKGRINGRTSEIKRIIGRSIRSILDLKKIPGKTVWIDCDVLQADGGTRTASINGAYVALKLAIQKSLKNGQIKQDPVTDSLGAVSVGLYENVPVLDLNYEEDSRAEADMNVVMSGNGGFVEIQATGEKRPFTEKEFLDALDLAKKGISHIITEQERVLS